MISVVRICPPMGFIGQRLDCDWLEILIFAALNKTKT